MTKMYYIYMLQCNDGTRYTGQTQDLRNPLDKHRQGEVAYARNKHPRLIYWEECATRSDAFKREMQLKNGRTRKETVEKLIKNFDPTKCQGFNAQTPSTLTKTKSTT